MTDEEKRELRTPMVEITIKNLTTGETMTHSGRLKYKHIYFLKDAAITVFGAASNEIEECENGTAE